MYKTGNKINHVRSFSSSTSDVIPQPTPFTWKSNREIFGGNNSNKTLRISWSHKCAHPLTLPFLSNFPDTFLVSSNCWSWKTPKAGPGSHKDIRCAKVFPKHYMCCGTPGGPSTKTEHHSDITKNGTCLQNWWNEKVNTSHGGCWGTYWSCRNIWEHPGHSLYVTPCHKFPSYSSHSQEQQQKSKLS